MDLQHRLENHWLACMAAVGGGARVTRMAGGLVCVNPAAMGYAFNFMLLRSVQPDRLDSVLEMGGVLLAGGERPPAVFLSPAAGDMQAVAAKLEELGWRRLLRQTVLVRNLPASVEPDSSPAIAVELVTARRLPVWRRTLIDAYEVDPLTGRMLTRAWGALLRAPGDGWWARGYLAITEGVPAGTGLLWSQGEIAGLYCGAVLPARRRLGIHRAIMLRRLSDARQAGCQLATLQTETGSPVEDFCLGQLDFTVSHHRELWVPATL